MVVSRDLTRCSDARHLARTLQAALDDWDRLAPQLELIARGVETGGQPVQRFHEREALAPLPRAYQPRRTAIGLRRAARADRRCWPGAARRAPIAFDADELEPVR